ASRLPSGEIDDGVSSFLPSVKRSAAPPPSERIQYMPGAPASVDLNTSALPSGVHTGLSLKFLRKLSRNGVSRSRSFTQRSTAVPPMLNANRLPSGESRGV